MCQSALTSEATPLLVWSEQHDAYAHTGFHLGDPVLCTRNLWDRGLQNGSLGIVVQIEDEPRQLTNEAGQETGLALAWVDWDDGVRRPIVDEMLDDLELGYAITVHKAQGSQWPRVIVPLTGSRLLDRTLIYTAITRAQRQVLLVGDEGAAERATKRPPRANSREVALDLTLTKLLADASSRGGDEPQSSPKNGSLSLGLADDEKDTSFHDGARASTTSGAKQFEGADEG